ncbi:MAG: hypothetical protein KIT25_24925 [Enhydrobacter sp.]|nr:MAG: hypothetical protein KIT25_24925 [Enhydrobacter sp.]
MTRNTNGTFGKGNKFGKGRLRGSRNWATIVKRHLREGDPRVPGMLLDDQLDRGRRWAVQVMLGVLPRPREPLPEFDMSDIRTLDDLIGAQGEILSATASGRIAPYAGKRLMDRLERRRAKLIGAR